MIKVKRKFGFGKILLGLLGVVILYKVIFGIVIPTYKKLNPPPFIKNFTTEQALEDYDFFWETIEARYPYSGLVERKTGIKLSDLKAEYRKKIEYYKDIDIETFHRIFFEGILKVKEVGHLVLFNSDMYYRFREIFDFTSDENIKKYNMENQAAAFNNEKTVEVYKYFRNESPTREKLMNNHGIGFGSSIKTDKIDENTAMLTLYSLKQKDIIKDKEKLLNFYKKIEDEGYKNLIIKNYSNGGSDLYWMDNIIAPNIDKTLTYKTKFFIKDYYKNVGLKIHTEFDKNKFPNMNEDDAKEFVGYIESDIVVEPLYDKKLFTGDIYLLVDSNNYSSTEAFAQFSKGTGFATLVGTQTGGDGYSGGTPMMTALPNSGFLFMYRIAYGINEDGSSNVEFGTSPDIYSKEGETPEETCIRYINSK